MAKTIATSIHSKVDYCNTLFLNLPRSQLDRLQLILNSAADRAVSKSPRFTHISPVLKSLHWLKIDQRIHYKILSTTYKTLQSRKPSYLHNLLHIQSDTCTRSSTTVTLKRPTVSSRLKITDRSFTHHSPVLWNALPKEFRKPAIHSSHTIQFGSTPLLLDLSITSQFHSKLNYNSSIPQIISSLVCFTHWCLCSGSLDMASGFPSHIHSRCIIHNHFISWGAVV